MRLSDRAWRKAPAHVGSQPGARCDRKRDAQPVCGAAGRNDHRGRWAGPGAGTVELNLREAAAQHRDDPGFFSPLTLFIGDTGFRVQPAA